MSRLQTPGDRGHAAERRRAFARRVPGRALHDRRTASGPTPRICDRASGAAAARGLHAPRGPRRRGARPRGARSAPIFGSARCRLAPHRPLRSARRRKPRAHRRSGRGRFPARRRRDRGGLSERYPASISRGVSLRRMRETFPRTGAFTLLVQQPARSLRGVPGLRPHLDARRRTTRPGSGLLDRRRCDRTVSDPHGPRHAGGSARGLRAPSDSDDSALARAASGSPRARPRRRWRGLVRACGGSSIGSRSAATRCKPGS